MMGGSPEMSESKQSPALRHRLPKLRPNDAVSWLFHAVNAVMLPFLLVMVMLRETDLFWTNAGGYPMWVRESVRYAFWPLLGIELVFLVLWTLAIVVQCKADGRGHWLMKLAAAFGWMFFAAILTVALWNNVENLMQGRDLHHHDPVKMVPPP